jgi:hypothetical protein
MAGGGGGGGGGARPDLTLFTTKSPTSLFSRVIIEENPVKGGHIRNQNFEMSRAPGVSASAHISATEAQKKK